MYYQALLTDPVNTETYTTRSLLTQAVIKIDPQTFTPVRMAVYEDWGFYVLTQERMIELLTTFKLELVYDPKISDELKALLD